MFAKNLNEQVNSWKANSGAQAMCTRVLILRRLQRWWKDKRSSKRDTERKAVLRRLMWKRLQCKVCWAPRCQVEQENTGNYVSKQDCRADKLWLKTDGPMLMDDKEKLELPKCLFPELLLLWLLFFFVFFFLLITLFYVLVFFCLAVVPLKKKKKLSDENCKVINEKRKCSPCCVKSEEMSTRTL